MTGPDGKPLKYENGKPKLKVVSKKGEIVVGMKDGVEYVLRFGDAYRGSEDEANATGESRYIYAFARLNPNLLEQPNMMPYPLLWPNPKNKTHQRIRRRKRKAKRVQKVKKGNKGKNPLLHSTLPVPSQFYSTASTKRGSVQPSR